MKSFLKGAAHAPVGDAPAQPGVDAPINVPQSPKQKSKSKASEAPSSNIKNEVAQDLDEGQDETDAAQQSRSQMLQRHRRVSRQTQASAVR
jgi:hypothetical protein